MAKTKAPLTPGVPPAPRATRTPRTLTSVEQAIVDEAAKTIKEAKAKIKETKHLGKAISLVNTLSEFGCEHVKKAIEARLEALANE